MLVRYTTNLLLADVCLEVGVSRPDGSAVHVLGGTGLGKRFLQAGDLLSEDVFVCRPRVTIEADRVLQIVDGVAIWRVAIIGVEAQLTVFFTVRVLSIDAD